MNTINLAQKLATFTEHWQPRTVGQFNGHDLMVVKVKGEFNWHSHPDTDDFFLVLKGRLTIQMREGNVTLGPGEMFVVPKGVEHCPIACAHLPSGFPDECDNCNGRPSGDYCGSEMGWDARNYNLLVRCTQGRLATSPQPFNCPTNCQTGNGNGTAKCSP